MIKIESHQTTFRVVDFKPPPKRVSMDNTHLRTHCKRRGHTEEKCFKKHGYPKTDASGTATTLMAKAGTSEPVAPNSTLTGSATSTTATPAYARLANVVNTGDQSDSTFEAVLDTGASDHTLMGNVPLENATTTNSRYIAVANGACLTQPQIGSVSLQNTGDQGNIIHLTNALSHSGMTANLLSVARIAKAPAIDYILFKEDWAKVVRKDGEVILKAQLDAEGVYKVKNMKVIKPENATALIATTGKEADALMLHARLSHPSLSKMELMIKLGLIDDLKGVELKTIADAIKSCEACIRGKAHRLPFNNPDSRPKITRPLQRLLVDEMGPFQVATLTGEIYILVIVDEYSDKVWVAFLKHKSGGSESIKRFIRKAEAELNLKVHEIHSDGGGEFLGDEFTEWCKTQGYYRSLTTAHTPQWNPIAERMNRTIIEPSRAMIFHANGKRPPIILYDYSVKEAVRSHNELNVKRGQTSTPNMLWNPNSNSTLSHFHVLFCDAWVHIPKADRQKLDAKAEKLLYLGRSDEGGYLLMDVKTNKLVRSRDVVRFEEKQFTQCAELVYAELTSNDNTLVNKDHVDYLDELMFRNHLKIYQLSREAAAPSIAPQPSASLSTPVVASADGGAVASGDENISTHDVSGIPHISSLDDSVFGPMFSDNDAENDSEDDVVPPLRRPKFADEDEEKHGNDDESSYAPSIDLGDGPVVPREHHERACHGVLRDLGKGIFREGDIAYNAEVRGTLELFTKHYTDPKNLREALMSPDKAKWGGAIHKELTSLFTNAVMKPIKQLPVGKSAIGTRLVLKLKQLVGIYKARLVALGYRQREGVDYHRTFAPTLGYASLRLILAMVASKDLELKQLDVETAFLNAPIQEDIYITLPPEIDEFHVPGINAVDKNGKPQVYKLMKSLYGIKQAPHDWNELLDRELRLLGYSPCISDPCVYVKRTRTNKTIIVPVFVDDMFPAYHKSDEAEWEADKVKLMAKYKIQDSGDAKLILGMRVTRDRANKTLKLDQEFYFTNILKEYDMLNSHPVETAERDGARYTKDGNANKEDDAAIVFGDKQLTTHEYHRLIGSLLYGSLSTRPDIAHAVCQLSRFTSDPKPQHWSALKYLLRYINGTKDLGLTFRGDTNIDPHRLGPAYADADWAGDPETRLSTSGVVVKFNGCAIAWRSKRQECVARSSCEAEYVALGESTKEILWLRSLLGELFCAQERGTTLYGDNETANLIAKTSVMHPRTKHIDIKHHSIRGDIASGRIDLQWIPTSEQEADLLTKAVGKNIFKKLRDKVMGVRDSAPRCN